MASRLYRTLNYPDSQPGDKTLLTGIRYAKSNYYITGFYQPVSGIGGTSFLYIGPLDGTGRWHRLNYPAPLRGLGSTPAGSSSPGVYPGGSPTSLYGPDVCKCCGRVTLVGNYGQQGVIYKGKPDGSGRWSLVSPPDAVGTIWHSTYGGLVVGNYKTAEDPSLTRACIYQKGRGFTQIGEASGLEYPAGASLTAYGIWSSNGRVFTICGGSHKLGVETAYLVDYDLCCRRFSNWRYYSYPKAVATHFDGISPGQSRSTWSLTGVSNLGSFQADISRRDSEKSVVWSDVTYPGAETTTGNSVYKNVVIGVYTVAGQDGVNGFVSF